MHNMEKEVLLSCKEIFKNFGPTRALVNVDFEIRRGEICGLIGENGSGKSTLTSIFAGIQPAVSGKMFRAGEEYHPANMLEAQQKDYCAGGWNPAEHGCRRKCICWQLSKVPSGRLSGC